MLPNEYQQSMEKAYQQLNKTGIKKVKNPNVQQFLIDAFNAFFISHQIYTMSDGTKWLKCIDSTGKRIYQFDNLSELCEFMSTEQTEIFDPGQLFKEESETHKSQKKITIQVENLDCPHCNYVHIDIDHWAEKPHKTHLCHFCHKEFEGTVKGVSRPAFTTNYTKNRYIDYFNIG